MALTYLVAQALYKKIAVSDLPLTALYLLQCPLAPALRGYRAVLGPQASARENSELSKDIRAALPKNADLLTVLETADSVTLEAENDKLLIGGTELISKKVELYYSYWKINSVVRHLIALATKNTADSPQEFFKHVTFAVSTKQVKKAQAEFDLAENVIATFLRTVTAPDPAC